MVYIFLREYYNTRISIMPQMLFFASVTERRHRQTTSVTHSAEYLDTAGILNYTPV